MIKRTVLNNNVTLITQHVENSKTVAVGFYFSVGSRFEKENQRGISHFCEHLLFKGTKSKSRREILKSFDRMGGLVNAFTERDDVCMYAIVPSSQENLSQTMDLLCDMSHNCIFPDDEIDKEKSVVENEIAAVEDDPEESSLDVLASVVWKGSALSNTITGSVGDVEKLKRNDIVDWYEKYFVHGELSVFVAGNFHEQILIENLNQLPVHTINSAPVFNEPVWQSGFHFKKSNFGQQQIYFAYPLKNGLTEKKYWAMTVFNALFGDTLGSRLFETLREDSGLCYNVYSFYSHYGDNGLWSCYASCDKNDTERAVALIKGEIENLLANGLDENEIANAKGHLCGEEIMGESDMEYLMRRLQKSYSLGIPLQSTEEILSSIRSVEKNDIIAFVKDLLNDDSRTIVVYGKKSMGISKI